MNLSLSISLLFLGCSEVICVPQPETHWVDHTEVRWQVREGEEAGMKSDYKYSWQYSQVFKEIVARLFTNRFSSVPDCCVGASDYYRKDVGYHTEATKTEWDLFLA